MTNEVKIPKSGITADIFGTILTLTFSDGKEIVVDYSTLTPELQKQAGLHGLKQKLVDGAAIPRSTETGRSATMAEKYEAIRDIADRLTHATNPTWNKIRGDREGAGNGLLVRALIQMSGKTRAEIEAKLEWYTKAQKTALRNHAKVAAIIAELKAAASGIDSDELLDELI